MGIDKPDIRLIVHRTAPTNLEAYVQEAGRAGRDGGLADVVLFYSPDTPQDLGAFSEVAVKSDDDIQRNFLRDKYVRVEDVRCVRRFLRDPGRYRRSNGEIVFTNDEFLAFVKDTEFEWPKFPPRESTGFESPEHKTILDRGHAYDVRTKYISKVLAVMYKIRPTVNGKQVVFLEFQANVSPVFIGARAIEPASILASNHYFGEILRNAKLTPAKFQQLFANAVDRKSGVVPLADLLEMTVIETCSMISDIRNCEGTWQNGKSGRRWQPSLLEYRAAVSLAKGILAQAENLTAWREYAGATRRAGKKKAEESARRFGRDKITDDWFGWDEVCRSTSWAVKPGEAIDNDARFEQYLSAFEVEQRERERSDWNAYELLLHDYVGVSDSRSKVQRGSASCLRAVMLGYLETGEALAGDDCGGCSRCRPAGNFERDLELRRSVVQHLSSNLSSFLSAFKEMPDRLPSQAETDRFWNAMEEAQIGGQQVTRYVQGWCAKQLEETPGHKTAMWLRLTSQETGNISLDVKEFHKYVQILAEALPNKIADLQRLVDSCVNSCGHESRIWYQIKAELHEQSEEHDHAFLAWWEVVTNSSVPYDECIQIAQDRIYRYSLPNGLFPDAEFVQRYGPEVARAATNVGEAVNVYVNVASKWSFDRLLEELNWWIQSATNWKNEILEKLFRVWLSCDSTVWDASHAISAIDEGFWAALPIDFRLDLIREFPEEAILAHDRLATECVELSLQVSSAGSAAILARAIRVALAHQWKPNADLRRKLCEFSVTDQGSASLCSELDSDETLAREIGTILLDYTPESPHQFLNWFQLVGEWSVAKPELIAERALAALGQLAGYDVPSAVLAQCCDLLLAFLIKHGCLKSSHVSCLQTFQEIPTLLPLYGGALLEAEYTSRLEDVLRVASRFSDKQLKSLGVLCVRAVRSGWIPPIDLSHFVGCQLFEGAGTSIEETLAILPEPLRNNILEWLPAYTPSDFREMAIWLTEVVLPAENLSVENFSRILTRVAQLGMQHNHQRKDMHEVMQAFWQCANKFSTVVQSPQLETDWDELLSVLPSEKARWLRLVVDCDAPDEKIGHALSQMTGLPSDACCHASVVGLARSVARAEDETKIADVEFIAASLLRLAGEIIYMDENTDSADHACAFLVFLVDERLFREVEVFELVLDYLEKAERLPEARHLAEQAEHYGLINRETAQTYLESLTATSERDAPDMRTAYRRVMRAMTAEWKVMRQAS